MHHFLKSVKYQSHPVSCVETISFKTISFQFWLNVIFPLSPSLYVHPQKQSAILLGTEWVSDRHLFHFSLAKLKKRRPIPLPAIASCEWLSGLGLVQGPLMVLSVSVKSLRRQVSQETPSSKVWLELSTWWMNRGQLGCHGWSHCDITNTVCVYNLRTSEFVKTMLVYNNLQSKIRYWLSYCKWPVPTKEKNTKITMTLRRIM